MPSYKLYYSNHKGLAEKCRLVFAAAGQKYEDKRFSREEIQAMREAGKFPVNQVPALEIDGVMYSESFAIASYLAKEFGLHGKTNLEQLQVEMVTGMIPDVYRHMFKWFLESDEEKKAAILKELNEVEYPKFLGYFETLLKKNGSGFFVGNKITLADILVFDTLDKIKAGLDLSKYPLVEAHIQKVQSNPNIAKWLKERPVTDL